MVGTIEDKILGKLWNRYVDRMNKLYITYVFGSKIGEKARNNLIKSIENYENRLKQLELTHIEAHPHNAYFNFRKVLKNYPLIREEI